MYYMKIMIENGEITNLYRLMDNSRNSVDINQLTSTLYDLTDHIKNKDVAAKDAELLLKCIENRIGELRKLENEFEDIETISQNVGKMKAFTPIKNSSVRSKTGAIANALLIWNVLLVTVMLTLLFVAHS